MDIYDVYEYARSISEPIAEAFAMTYALITKHGPEHCAASISGGSDSDIVLDICARLDPEKRIHYVFFDTGMEMKATKAHIQWLQERYKIHIETVHPPKSIPQAVKEYGQPAFSKIAAQYIEKLQKARWNLTIAAPSTRRWYLHKPDKGIYNQYVAAAWPHLTEYLSLFPPAFKISPKCCYWTKKIAGRQYAKEHNITCQIIGLRTAEGGARSADHRCYIEGPRGTTFRPINHFNNKVKARYNKAFGIINSDAYTIYGMKRTGCIGCPFNSRAKTDLENIVNYEPGMVHAAENIFGDALRYIEGYKQYKLERYNSLGWSEFEQDRQQRKRRLLKDK